MSEVLKPCSICGCQPRRNGRGGLGGVLCTGSLYGVTVAHRVQTYGADQADADEAWNTRATVAGYVLVPSEPTEVMCEAGWQQMPDSIAEAYRAMLAAARKPSPATLASETNKDRSGKHGREVA